MSVKIIKTVFQFRRDTEANWILNKDVIPAPGEPCFILDKNILKIGDGVKTFENLPSIQGVSLDVDGTSLIFEDGVLKVAGFEAAEIGAQPRKNADGKIEWVVPSTETVEGLQTTVAGLQSDVTNLQTNVTNLQEIVGTSTGEGDSLINRIAALEGSVETLNGEATVEGSVKKIVTDEIDAFTTKLTDDGVVNSFKELVDYVAEHGPEVAEMAENITILQELVGNTSVESQINNAISNINVGITGIKLNGTLIETIEGQVDIPMGAGLKASDEVTIAEDGSLGIGTISFDKIIQGTDEIVFDGGASI